MSTSVSISFHSQPPIDWDMKLREIERLRKIGAKEIPEDLKELDGVSTVGLPGPEVKFSVPVIKGNWEEVAVIDLRKLPPDVCFIRVCLS